MAHRYGKKASEKVGRTMHEFKHGTLRSGSGGRVTSRQQALAIGISQARKEGYKVPPQRGHASMSLDARVRAYLQGMQAGTEIDARGLARALGGIEPLEADYALERAAKAGLATSQDGRWFGPLRPQTGHARKKQIAREIAEVLSRPPGGRGGSHAMIKGPSYAARCPAGKHRLDYKGQACGECSHASAEPRSRSTLRKATDAEIRSLRREAEEAGDLRQAMICVLAIGGPAALEGAEPGTEADSLLSEGHDQAWARQECARVIAEASAQHSHATRRRARAPRVTPYQIFLTPGEIRALEYARGRYAWPDMLSAHLDENGNVAFTESEMWQWVEDVDSDAVGGHSPFPLAAGSLVDKLQRFYDSRV